MDGLNQVTLVGSVGKDADVKTINDNSQVAKFGLATNRSYKDKNGEKQTHTEWHNIEVWGDTAKFAGNYVKKGGLILVVGEIRYEKFDDKDGNPQQRTKIVANKIQLFPKGGNGEAKAEIAGAAKETADYVAEGAETKSSSSNNDDLPF